MSFNMLSAKEQNLGLLFNEVLVTESYFKSETKNHFQNDETGCIMKTIWWQQHFCRKINNKTRSQHRVNS